MQGWIQELHSSSGQFVTFGMRYQKSADSKADEFSRYRVDGKMVTNMKHALTVLPIATRPA
ncbi:hypothetical protein [Sodalis sp.]|uniref:hypothetical protein n=1 Tax=Sodalis sp. (in: enterobacteria) TaxID=1898979 RepID=UPI0038733310